MVLTGSRQIWAYVWEDDGEYAQEPGEVSDNNPKAFGDDEDVNDPDADNSEETYFRPFSRQPSTYHEMEFDGSWGTDFTFTNPWWLAFIYGEPEITDNADTWDLEFEESPTSPPRSAQLIEETHYSDGTVEQTVYTGAAVDSPSISTSIQDTLDVSLDGFYADERHYDNASNSPYGELGEQPSTDFSPLNFANTELYLDLNDSGDADFRGKVQDVDVSFNSNIEAEFELGTRFATGRAALDFEADLSYTARVSEDLKSAERTSFYGNQVDTSGDATIPAEELSDVDVIGNVDLYSRKEENSLTLDWGEAFPSTFQRSNTGDPQSAVDDDVDRSLINLTASATVGVDPNEYF